MKVWVASGVQLFLSVKGYAPPSQTPGAAEDPFIPFLRDFVNLGPPGNRLSHRPCSPIMPNTPP